MPQHRYEIRVAGRLSERACGAFPDMVVDTESPTLAAWQEVYQRHGRELAMADWQRALGTHDGFDPHAHLIGLTGGSYAGDPVEVRIDIRRRCADEPLRPGVLALVTAAGVAVAAAPFCRPVYTGVIAGSTPP